MPEQGTHAEEGHQVHGQHDTAIAFDGAMISYRTCGDPNASPVLLVHGGLFDPMDGVTFWISPGVASDLAARHRVLVPDRRFGSGSTRAPFAVHTWDVEASDLGTVLDAAGIANAHVVAGSNGCSAAIRFARRSPERTRSLVLCSPSTPDPTLRTSFALSAAAIASLGTAGYIDTLRSDGLPRPDELRPGFPFGVALLHDDAFAEEFGRTSNGDAAQIVRDTANALLAGDLLRGVDLADARHLAKSGLPIAVVPALPPDRHHTAEIAASLTAALPGASVLPGAPPPPAPHFQDGRRSFASALTSWIRSR